MCEKPGCMGGGFTQRARQPILEHQGTFETVMRPDGEPD
jgi:hypothetical protein